ncbi:MAG TPA: chemotaxis protein CheD [Clostridiaceae bacterium]|nr:chemotaxis protein CheD [Clostridiaceae bacterium]
MTMTVNIGMAELKALNHPGILITLGLGSCVGVALYDRKTKVIGLAHIMLPSSANVKKIDNEAKFADTAIVKLLNDMYKLGASKENIVAKLAGGAQMFTLNNNSDIIRIGERNIQAAKEKLAELGIDVVAEDTGGNFGRTIEFYSDDGSLKIKRLGYGIKII